MTATPGPQLRVVNFIVQDMAAAVAFYRAVGFDIDGDTDQPHLDVRFPNGTIIAWDTAQFQGSLDSTLNTADGKYAATIEFWLDDRDSVDRKYAELTAAGYRGRAEPFDAPWGPRYALIDDPDGNVVALSSPLDLHADTQPGAATT